MSPTPPKPKDVLEKAAGELARTAPNRWSEFVAAFEAYAADRRDACVQAPADKVLLAQGMARQCIELRSLLIDASKPK